MALAHHVVEIVIGGENQGANPPQYAGGLNRIISSAVPLNRVIPVGSVRGLWWEPIDNLGDISHFKHIEVQTRDDDNVNILLSVTRACLLRVRLHILFEG